MYPAGGHLPEGEVTAERTNETGSPDGAVTDFPAMDGRPALRAILLGASNLTMGLPLVVDGLRLRAGGPVQVLAACGQGRSYGAWSRFFFVRGLPAILDCGLWRELDRLPPLPTVALVTDVGNDLIYGVDAATVASWVEACLGRLAGQGAETVLTLLPLPRLERLTPGQYLVARSLLFPGRGVPWPRLQAEARELDARLRRIGTERGVPLVEPEASWYGIDPIHVRRSLRREVWDRVFSLWPVASMGPSGRESPPQGRCRPPLFGAACFRLFETEFRRPQPAVRLDDGTTLSLF